MLSFGSYPPFWGAYRKELGELSRTLVFLFQNKQWVVEILWVFLYCMLLVLEGQDVDICGLKRRQLRTKCLLCWKKITNTNKTSWKWKKFSYLILYAVRNSSRDPKVEHCKEAMKIILPRICILHNGL